MYFCNLQILVFIIFLPFYYKQENFHKISMKWRFLKTFEISCSRQSGKWLCGGRENVLYTFLLLCAFVVFSFLKPLACTFLCNLLRVLLPKYFSRPEKHQMQDQKITANLFKNYHKLSNSTLVSINILRAKYNEFIHCEFRRREI